MIIKLYFFIILTVVIVSCQNKSDYENKLPNNIDIRTNDSIRKYFKENLAYPKDDHDDKTFEDFKQYYFPPNSIDSFKNAWFTYHLYALEEYPIDKEMYVTKYRFLWLRSFHKPVCITLSKSYNQILLELKTSDGYGGYHSGVLEKDLKVYLKDSIWNDFEKRINTSGYWKLPSQYGEMGGDGSMLVLEARKQNKYHISTTWSLDYKVDERKTKFQNLCIYLIDLAEQNLSLQELKEKY